ncbi:MAG TPA: hypothetical protein VEK07_24910 [Polyangiaceae bacterium]|nr:hypothetical protein [Polyangiaceae bacterium]
MTGRSAAHILSMRRTLVTSAFALAALLPVRAVAADSAEDAHAQTLFEAAMQLQKSGQIADACPMFAQSNRLAPGVGVSLHLADCYEHLGRTASAWSQFRAAERMARARGDVRRADLAHERALALAPNLDRLTVTTGAGPHEGWHVVVDGAVLPADRWNTPLAVDPGDHLVLVQAPGRPGLPRRVHVDASHPTVLVNADELAPVPVAAASPVAGAAQVPAVGAPTEATPATVTTPAQAPAVGAPAASGAVANASPAPAVVAPAGGPAVASPPTAAGSTPSPSPEPNESSAHDVTAPAGGSTAQSGSGTRLGIAIGLAGLGAVGAGFGTFFLIRRSVFISHDCPCDTSLENEASTGATISFGVAGAALASSAVLLLTGSNQKSQVGWAFGPAPMEGGAGAILRAGF